MGCIYCDSDGECSINEESLGKDNLCIYEDDPNPADSCPNYESDNICSICGQDLNVEECDCDNCDDD